MDNVQSCIHCGAATAAQAQINDSFDGEPLVFCCHGCRLAYRIICGAGLSSYYQTRQMQQTGLPSGAYTIAYDDVFLQQYVTTSPGVAQISFLVEGVRCASCVWVIERVLERLDGVRQVRLNYGTHRAQVSFDPEAIGPARLLGELASLGYVPRPFSLDAAQQSAAREGRQLLIRFGTAALFSMQVMGFTIPLYAGYFQGIDESSRQAMTWLAALTALPVVFYSGWPFLRGAWRSLRNRTANMDLLVALGVLVTFLYSLVALVRGGEVYFDTAVMIITLILLGRLLEHFARQRAMSRIDRLLQLAPECALRIDDGTPVNVPSSQLRPGDRILVRPGDRFPVDGEILDGTTEIDEAAVSGEPLPVLRAPGEAVSAGTVNLVAAVTVKVTSTTADSLVARIARLVEDALARRAPIQRLADRSAAVFVPAVLVGALLTALGWMVAGSTLDESLLCAVSVLVVACPCALGLATPMAILVASGAGASRGILFRGGDVIERAGKIDHVAFDKTGTLTIGRPYLVAIRPAPGIDEATLLDRAAVAAQSSSHPLAVGIARDLREHYGRTARQPGLASALPGRGVVLEVPDGILRMGNRELLEEAGIALRPFGEQALTEVHLSLGQCYLGGLLLDDPLRDEARTTIDDLHALGIRTAILTGDRANTAQRVAACVGIDEIASQLTPDRKADWIHCRTQQGANVLMVGDGINDAPALSAASVGCAMAGGTAIAMETSDLVLTRPSLERLAEAVRLARRCVKIIRQNLFWAFFYNLLALPLAASGRLVPIHAAAAMALSSLCVVGNSLRLARRSGAPRC